MHNYVRTLGFRGWGYFLWPNFISQKVKVSPSIHLNKCKYYVCGIKLETKVMRLHKIRVEKKCAVNSFWLLPVMFQGQPVWRALSCIISGFYLIHLFGVRFLLWTGRIPIKYQRTAVQKLFRVHHRPRWCGRSREVTWSNKNGWNVEWKRNFHKH